MPACLFNTDSPCHTQTHIRDGWHTKPCATKTDSAQCVFLSILSAIRRKSQPVSAAASARHCRVLSHYPAAPGGGGGGGGCCAELWDGQAFCGLSDSIRKMTCLFSLAVDMLQTSPLTQTHQCESQTDRQMKGDRQTESGVKQVYIYCWDASTWVLLPIKRTKEIWLKCDFSLICKL